MEGRPLPHYMYMAGIDERGRRALAQKPLQDRLALDQRQRPEVAAVEIQAIEQDLSQLGGPTMAAKGFLERSAAKSGFKGFVNLRRVQFGQSITVSSDHE